MVFFIGPKSDCCIVLSLNHFTDLRPLVKSVDFVEFTQPLQKSRNLILCYPSSKAASYRFMELTEFVEVNACSAEIEKFWQGYEAEIW